MTPRFPTHGMCVAGNVHPCPTPQSPRIPGLWPTPLAGDVSFTDMMVRTVCGLRRGDRDRVLAEVRGIGSIDPRWTEALMGFPQGWV